MQPEKKKCIWTTLMGKTSSKKTPDILATTIQKIWTEGAWLMPTGGDDGKRPLLKFSQKTRHSLNLVTQTLERANSQTYGVRLRNIVVLDIDNNDTDLIDEMHQRFGRTNCMVQTGRGFHLYYSSKNKFTENLRASGLPIDIKQGANAIVLGPHSLRPDGVFYEYYKEPFSLGDLPYIQQNAQPAFRTVFSAKNKAPEGNRHDFLVTKGREYVEHVESKEELLENLFHDRDTYCTNPSTVPDAEVEAIVKWYWDKRLQNQIYTKNNSVFKFPRQAYHNLRALPNGYVALDLYLYLQDKHGHILGKTFEIKVNALQKTAGFAYGQKALHNAINQLLELGHLTIFKSYSVGKHGRIFQLSRPENVV